MEAEGQTQVFWAADGEAGKRGGKQRSGGW